MVIADPARFAASSSPNDTTRRANLSLVLSLVHHRGALSRAELTRATGLNRSTIATLVGHLAELRLVYEAAALATSQIGRPSPIVHPSTLTAALAVNPEVDAITVGLVGLGGEVIRKIRMPTQSPPTAIEVANITAAIVEGIRTELESHYRIVGIGVVVAGLQRAEDGVVTYAPHLGWRDESNAALIAEATGFASSAANDASLGAGAELLVGAGQGCHDLIYLNGGASGCLEAEISLSRLQQLVGLEESDIDVVERALYAGAESIVMPEVNRQIDHLATTLCNAVNMFNPERIVLGGFLGTLFAFAPDRLTEQVQSRSLHGPGELVQISRAVLGSNIFMIGAAELVFAGILADPVGATIDHGFRAKATT